MSYNSSFKYRETLKSIQKPSNLTDETMSTANQENVVILDCEDLTSSIVTKDTVFGVIHKQLLNRLSEQIHESVSREKAKRAKRKLDSFIEGSKREDNFPLNYYISGERGSGKTTFLEQLEERVKYSDYNDVKIKFLLWYDPSQSFGVPNDLFITVTAAVKTRMRKLAHEPDRQKEYNSHRYRFCEEKLDKLDKDIVRFSQKKEALSNMSEYRASALSSEDPEMNNNIRENFRESMKLLCELEQADAFVLVIDDVDIRTKQCYNVLEDLRLYLSNDYLIVLMAGDRENNLEHVREKFFKEYDIEYHRADRHGREVRMNSTVSHAAQYFAKLFPVKQQFELSNLYALSNKYNALKLKIKYKGKEEFLRTWVRRIFMIAISINVFEAKSYADTLISFPLRNIIQILDYWIKNGMWERLNAYHSNSDKDKKGKRAKQIELLVRTALNRSLQDQLPELSDNYKAFDSGDRSVYYALLLRLCQETGDFEHGYYLSCERERNSQHKFLILVLAANFRRHLMHLGGFLSYWLYGPASVALYGKALEQFLSIKRRENSILKTQDDLRRSFNEYLQVGKPITPAQWAKRANMIWCRDYKGHHVHSGVVRIQKSETIEKLGGYLIEDNQDEAHFKKAIALIVSMTKSDGRDNSYYISIHAFLAFILECVETCDKVFSIVEDGEKRKKLARAMLDQLIARYFPIMTCRRPEWQGTTYQEKEQETIILVQYEDMLDQRGEQNLSSGYTPENAYLYHLIGEIVEWYTKIREDKADTWKKDDISPQFMGELWSLFYGSIRTVSQASSKTIAEKDIFPGVEKNKGPYKSYLEVFHRVISILKPSESYRLARQDTATEYYIKCISNFPLTKHFGLDIDGTEELV